MDALGLETLDYSNKEGAQNALESLDASQLNVNGMRANLGALQNRLTSTVENLAVGEKTFLPLIVESETRR